MCAVVAIAPSTYFRHRARQVDPTGRSTRARRDDELRIAIRRIWDANFQVYGPRKVWRELRRQGLVVARCTVVRLMREMGLAGAVRGRAWITTTHAQEGGDRPTDRVDRRAAAGCLAGTVAFRVRAPVRSSSPRRRFTLTAAPVTARTSYVMRHGRTECPPPPAPMRPLAGLPVMRVTHVR